MATVPPPIPAQAVDPCSALLLNDTMLSRFAMEVARDIYDFPVICSQYGITEELFNQRICHTTQFMRYYAEHHALWNSPLSATQRVAAKAGVVVEDFLLELSRLMADPAQPMTAKVDAFKHLTKISGIDNVNPVARDAQGGGGGPAHATVVINLGHAKQIVIEPGKVTDVEELPEQVNEPAVQFNMPGAVQFNPHSPVPQAPRPSPTSPLMDGEARFGAGRSQVVNGQDLYPQKVGS